MISKRPSAAGRSSPQPNLPLQKLSGPVNLPSRRTLARGGITSSKGASRQGHGDTNQQTKPKSPSSSGHVGALKAHSDHHQGDGQA